MRFGAYAHPMIVVVGSPIGRFDDGAMAAGGPASRVALAAARAGRSVQLVGRTGDDPTADGVLRDLAQGGVGHVALLRDPARATPLEQLLTEDDETARPADHTDHPGLPGNATPAPWPALEPADVDLGLRYLIDFEVVVLAEPASLETVATVADAALWGAARLILVVRPGESVPDGLPPDAIVFEAPDADPDGVFATLVGRFAAALDDGHEPGEAFRASIASDGWTGSADD